MILNETRDVMMMKRTLSPTALVSSSSSSSFSCSPSLSSSVSSSSTTSSPSSRSSSSSSVDKHATGSNSLVQLVKPSDQLNKIEQFSRKLSEFDLKLNGFKPRSGQFHLTNSTTTTTTSKTTTTPTTSSTRLTTTSRSTTGLSLIRSSLPNYISHLTDRELEIQHEIDSINNSKNQSYYCDTNELKDDQHYQNNNGNKIDDSDYWRKRLNNNSRDENYCKRSTSVTKPSLTFDSFGRRKTFPRTFHSSSLPSSPSKRSSTSKSLQSSPIDSNLGSTDFNYSPYSSPSSPSPSNSSLSSPSSSPIFTSPGLVSSSSARKMQSSSSLVSSKFKSEIINSNSPSSHDCVDYVNPLQESPTSPRLRVTRYTRSNRSSKEINQISNGSSSSLSSLSSTPIKSTRSYSRLNSLPCNNRNDCDNNNSDGQQSTKTRNYLRALSIPNGLNGDSINCYNNSHHRSNSDSRESLETSNNQRIVGSLFNSPKWSIIKEKFENSDYPDENKDNKSEIISYSSPQLRRKTYPTTSPSLTPSYSLSNLTLLASNNPNRGRSTSLTPAPSMDNPNRCSSTSSTTSSSSNSSSSTLTDKSYLKSIDKPNLPSSSGRLTSTPATYNSLSPSHSLENHGNYPIEKMCNSGKINTEQGSRMKSNSRIAQIASKFDSNVNQSSSPVDSVNCGGQLNKVKPWKSKSDLRVSNRMISTSSSTSSISLLSVHKNLSEQSNHQQSTTKTNSSNSLSTIIGGKSTKTNQIDEKNDEKIVSVKETVLRLECIKSSSTSLSTISDNVNQSTIKINRSTSDQQSSKPIITPRRKTLPGVTFLHSELTNHGEKSPNNDNCNDKMSSSFTAKESDKFVKLPLPAPRKISNNQDKNSSKLSPSPSPSTLSTTTTFLSSSIVNRNRDLTSKGYNELNHQQIPKESSHFSPSPPTSSSSSSSSFSSSPTTSTLTQSKALSLMAEDIKKTPSFLWSNNPNPNHSYRLRGNSCSLSSSLTNVKESSSKKQESASRQFNQSVSNINLTGNNNNNNNPPEEPIYEPVSYSPTPIAASGTSVNKNISTSIISSTRTVFHDYDDNLSLTSENSSSLSFSDSGSYSSGVHEPSTLSSSSTTSSSNRSPNNRTTTPTLSSILPPPLPPRWTEASKQSNSVNTFTTTFTPTAPLINSTSSFGINLDGLETYISNQWNNKEDSYGADHIYDSIHYTNLSDELILDKSEMLSKMLKELEDISSLKDRKVREDNSTNSYDVCISRTPSTLSCSSISRNGSNASDSRDKSSEEFSLTPRSSESDSPPGTMRDTISSSQIPPRVTPRSTIKSSRKDCDSFGGYANFPSILEDRVLSSGSSLMDSILESSSPSLRESIQREMKRSEYHSETLMKNSSFLHSNRLSIVSKKSADYVEAIDPSDQKKPNINDLYREGLIHPESRYETHEFEGYMEFKETRGFFSSTAEQPLYQLYDEQVKHNRILWASGLVDDSHEDDLDPLDAIYAELDGASTCECNSCESGIDDDTTPGASLSSSIASTTRTTPHISAIDLVGKNGNRQLWCEVPQVKEAGVAAKLTPKERKHQEAMFEVITSEASYLKSLDILVNHFMKSDEFSNSEILNPHDRSGLFSNIESVFEITRRLMKDLDDRWQTNVVISDVCDILLRYSTAEFDEYIKYLRFYKKQEKTLKTLQKQAKFAVALKQLETNPKCHGLALTSFLLLPMQRITRYPLLVEAILNHRPPTETNKYEICQKTLAALYKVVNDCNEEAKKTERLQELIDLDSILNFDKVKYFPLISESRHLMKKDEVVRWKQTTGSIIPARGKNPLWKKSPLHLYLFNDLLLIASKKSEICYSVNDYCERNCLTVRSIDVPGEEGTPPVGMKSSLENLVQLTFLKNHARRTSEYYIAFPTETDKIRFIEAIEPPKSDKPNEKIYEEWDCPQVICERQYIAQQPDELSLEKSDVVNVFRKTNDWYEGERIRDGARGWFPASCTQEIVNKHVRSRNLKLRHRLMTLTEQHILEMQKNQ